MPSVRITVEASSTSGVIAMIMIESVGSTYSSDVASISTSKPVVTSGNEAAHHQIAGLAHARHPAEDQQAKRQASERRARNRIVRHSREGSQQAGKAEFRIAGGIERPQ